MLLNVIIYFVVDVIVVAVVTASTSEFVNEIPTLHLLHAQVQHKIEKKEAIP